MITARDLALAPGDRVRRLAARVGEARVAEWCAGILAGSVRPDSADAPSLTWLGGRHGEYHLDRHRGRADQEHWPRVWAARALLYVWADEAGPAVIGALRDSAWRVREMAAKVVRLRELGDAEDLLVECLDDPVPRVRAAAARALGRVGDLESEPLMHGRLDDADPVVRLAARAALRELRRRLDG